jgi:hypothetical protein
MITTGSSTTVLTTHGKLRTLNVPGFWTRPNGELIRNLAMIASQIRRFLAHFSNLDVKANIEIQIF